MIVYTDKHRVPFQIDEDDFEAVRRYTWCMNGHGYDHGYPATNVGRWPHIRCLNLHLFLMGPAPKGLEWDHRNRDKTDNRRENLRAVSSSVNTHNVGLISTNTSGVRGVTLDARRSWRARITINGRNMYLGNFSTLAEAAAARLAAEADFWRAQEGSLREGW